VSSQGKLAPAAIEVAVGAVDAPSSVISISQPGRSPKCKPAAKSFANRHDVPVSGVLRRRESRIRSVPPGSPFAARMVYQPS